MSLHGPFDTQPGPPARVVGVGADQALAGLRVSGPGASAGLDRFRLIPSAAGALRAALDCLMGDERTAAVQVMADESALEVRCARIDPEGLSVAGGVLETVEGNIAPTPSVPGSWTLRLPLLSSRETFLMFECGGLAMALPWHAVGRVRMTPRDALIGVALQEGIPVVSPLGLPVDTVSDGPAILVGLGRRRAYVLADRLVWRLAAEPHDEPPAPPDPRLGPALHAGDGRMFWLLDPAEVLREVPLPLGGISGGPNALPASRVQLRAPMVESQAESAAFAPPETTAMAPTGTPVEAVSEPRRERPRLRLIELTRDDVEPLGNDHDLPDELFEPWGSLRPVPDTHPPDAGAVQPAPDDDAFLDPVMTIPDAEDASETPAPAVAEPISAASTEETPAPAPRALVAEDSITACIFLERLLGQRGFAVLTVGSARDLRTTVARESWDLVLVDVDLPDAPGGSGLVGLGPRRADGAGSPTVALVRDREDSALARAAGVAHVLRKPFESADLDHVLAALGLAGPPGVGRS
ncbi:MAG: response regulator [Candidatus Eisenbacteria bacterium]